MSGQVFSIGQLVESAEQDARSRFSPSRQVKTAAAAPAATEVDLLDTDTVTALAKVGRDLAKRMKLAEDSAGGMEGSSGVNTGSAGEGMKDSLTPSADHPEEHKEPTGDGPPDVSPAKNPLSIPVSTDAKPGDGTMTSGPSKPSEFLSPKIGSFDPVRAVHERYARTAAQMAKRANSPGSIPDQVDTKTGPMVGPGKPESASTSGDTNAGKGDEQPPPSYEGVKAVSRQETHEDAVEEAAKATGLPGAAAKDSTEGVLNEVIKNASSDETKAAAFRAWYNTLPPNSKVASLIRNKVAALGKKARLSGTEPRSIVSESAPSAGTPLVNTRDAEQVRDRAAETGATSGRAPVPVMPPAGQ